MTATDCPSREKLREYSVGMLSEAQSDELAAHLDSCPGCQATILTLEDAADTLVGRLRTPPTAEPYSAEPAFQAALAQVLQGGTGILPVLGRDTGKMPVPPSEDNSVTSLPRALGEYQVLEELGHGGMGRVYKAWHTKLDRVVAVKVLTRSRAADRQAIDRFGREMKAVGRLAHPNIVQAYDAREIDGTPVLVMEFVDGMDLAQLVRRAGRLPVAEACELARQTAVALQCAHEHGLVHRDIKPSNIMLARTGEVKLLDLGLARFYAGGTADRAAPAGAAVQLPPQRAAGGTEVSSVLGGTVVSPVSGGTGKMPVPPSDDMTGTGQAMGTADYMAPEQAADSRAVDIRADLYSLGCTLYKLISGQAPFTGPAYPGTLEKMHAHVHQPVPPIRQLVPSIPDTLAAILDRMLAKNPGERFATPAEVAQALAPFCAGADLPALLQRAEASIASPLPPGEGQGEGLLSSPLPPGEGQREGRPAPRATSRRWRSIPAVLGLAFLFGGFCFALGIMIRITRDGHETAIEVPEGSTTRVGADGQVEVALPGQKPAQAARPITFRTAPITRGDLVQTVSATGTLEPEEVVDVGAKVTGQIISLGIDPSDPAHQKKIDYGAVVHKGTVLASIDDALYKARVAHSEAGLRRAEAELTVARAKQQPPDLAKATVIAAESVVQQSKADLEQAKTDLDHTVITSPVEGVIIDRRVNVGQTVVAGQNAPSLFLIAKDLRRVQIWASVNEADIARIHVGLPVHFTVDAYPGETFHGKVTQVRLNATMTQRVVTYTVVVATDNHDGRLLPYLTALVQFEVGSRKNVLLVPQLPLRWKPRPEQVAADVRSSASNPLSPGSGRLWVRDRDGKHVRQVTVQVGPSDGKRTEVSGPEVKEGMEVVFWGTAGGEAILVSTGQPGLTSPRTAPPAQQPPQPPVLPPLQFGPLIEQVVNAASEKEVGSGLDLMNGKLVELPKDSVRLSARERDKWSTENNVDLVVEFVKVPSVSDPTPALVPEGLKLAAVADERWTKAAAHDLQSALASGAPGGADFPVALVSERRGITYFTITRPLPATFAFQTRKGDFGVLQVLRYTEEPHGVRLRYKLAQSPATGAVPAAGRAAETPAVSPSTAHPGTTVLYFYADWAGPCQRMAPLVDALAGEGYAIQRVNIDRERALAKKFGITTVPCLVVLEQGKEVDRVVGVATLQRVAKMLPVPAAAAGAAAPPSVPEVSVSRPVVRDVAPYEDFTGRIEAAKPPAPGAASIFVVFDADQRTVLQIRRLVLEEKKTGKTPTEFPVRCALADDKDFPYRGKLESVDVPIDPKTGTATWRALLPNPEGILMPSLFVRVRLVLGARARRCWSRNRPSVRIRARNLSTS